MPIDQFAEAPPPEVATNNPPGAIVGMILSLFLALTRQAILARREYQRYVTDLVICCHPNYHN